MKLFDLFKTKSSAAPTCACQSEQATTSAHAPKTILVLGAGCKTCHQQYENVRQAVAALEFPTEVRYVTDMQKVMSYGVMSVPAIVVDDKVVASGKLLNLAEVIRLLIAQK